MLAILMFLLLSMPPGADQTLPAPTDAALKQRTPVPNLAIDCGGGQSCTGTVCVADTKVGWCEDSEFECANDYQVWAGGNSVCCTSKTVCNSCPYVDANGQPRTFKTYSFTGTTTYYCVVP